MGGWVSGWVAGWASTSQAGNASGGHVQAIPVLLHVPYEACSLLVLCLLACPLWLACPPAAVPMAAKVKAPAWLQRPCGAAFGFGGKLVQFTNTKRQLPTGETATTGTVTISQVRSFQNREFG